MKRTEALYEEKNSNSPDDLGCFSLLSRRYFTVISRISAFSIFEYRETYKLN